MMTNLVQVMMSQKWMLKLTAVSCLMIAFQGFSPGKLLQGNPGVQGLGESDPRLSSSGTDYLADYKPSKDTGQPSDSTGAGGRTFRIEIPS